MKRINPKFFIWLFLAIISTGMATFFIAAALKTKPFQYDGHMHVDAVKDIDIHGRAIGRVVVVEDFLGEVSEGLEIIVLREFEEGEHLSVEILIDYNEETEEILTDMTTVFEEVLTKSDIRYIYIRDGHGWEIFEYLITKKDHATVFGISTSMLALLMISMSVATFIKKETTLLIATTLLHE